MMNPLHYKQQGKLYAAVPMPLDPGGARLWSCSVMCDLSNNRGPKYGGCDASIPQQECRGQYRSDGITVVWRRTVMNSNQPAAPKRLPKRKQVAHVE